MKSPKIRGPLLLEALRETCLMAGFLMLARGLWLLFPPVMWITCGVILIYIGLPPRNPFGR